MTEPRSLSLGTAGERTWQLLRANHTFVPGRGCSIVVSDSADVRDELRRRLDTLAPRCERLEPSPRVLAEIHAIARQAAREQPPLVWVEASASTDPDSAWAEALVALNRGRDLVWQGGPVYVVLAGPPALHEQLRTIAPDLASTIRAFAFEATLDPLPEPSGPLCWLHLSDIHVSSHDWELDTVLGALLRDLPGLLAQAQREPQLLFVTGDIANKARVDEYEAARELFEALAGATGIPGDRMFMVPGNHDVDRGQISRALQRSERLMLEEVDEDEQALRDTLDEVFDDVDALRRHGQRFVNWCSFTDRVLGRARSVSIDQPWRSDIVELAGIRVGVASLCTAWLSGAGDAKGKLVLGERQLRALIAELREGGAQLRVALMHHPTSWLREAESETIHALLRSEFDVVLHGHQHRAKAGTFVHGQRDTVEIGAGATYAGLAHDRHHGFSVVQLDVATGQLVIDAFTYSSRSGGHWHLDAGFDPAAPQGRLVLPLRLARIGATPVKGEHDALAARIRRATLSVHGRQAFVGLPRAAPRPKANLRDVFVPLELHERGRGNDGPTQGIAALSERWLAGEAPARAVVLGDPGSGKSTLCKYLAVEAAERAQGPTPIVMTVREWAAEGAKDGLLALAQKHVEQHLSIRCSTEALAELAARGQLVLLIDGIDEAGPTQRVRLRERIDAFVGEYPKVGVIATSRIVGYDEAALERGFEHLVLMPFDDARLRDFIDRWYANAEPDDAAERRRKSAALWSALQAEPQIAALARNPLLATLIAMVHFHRAELPGDRAKLYALVIELMIVTWPNACGRALRELEGYAQIPMLEELALGMQRERSGESSRREVGIVITRATLIDRLEGLLAKHREELDLGRRRALAHAWAHWLVADAGLVQEIRHEKLGFLHLSLLEYLAGQAALREQGRAGHEAIAQFVVAHVGEPHWREVLLSMVGSRNDERELGNAVVEALLGVAGWAACMLLLGLLREEVEIDAELRSRVLDRAAEQALAVWRGNWPAAQTQIGDVLQFGRKHREPTRRWIELAMQTRQGHALVDVLVLLPEAVEASPAMQARSDADLGLGALLDLGSHPWGRWAAARASETTWRAWCWATPLRGILWRALSGGWERPAMWVVALARRSRWMAQSIEHGARILRGQAAGDGFGLPARMRWSAEVDASLAPAVWGTAGDVGELDFARDFALDFALDFARYFVRDFALDFARYFALDFARDFALDFARYFARYFARDFALDFARDFARYFARDFALDFVRYFALDFARDFALDFALDFARDFALDFARYFALDFALNPSHAQRLTPRHASPFAWNSLARAATVDKAREAAAPILLQSIADAHAGLMLTPAGERGDLIAEARIHNCGIHYLLDPLLAYVESKQPHPLTPEQDALALALGLAQYQTTWAWPASERWRAYFSAPAPTHWLAAHVWHLCWAVGEPHEGAHLERAAACLERADDPELVAELRKYPIIPTPPEVLALFDGQPTHDGAKG